MPYTPGVTSPVPPEPVPEQTVRDRIARFSQERDAVTRRWNRVANIRLVAFFLAAAGAFWAIRARSLPVGIVAALLFVAFLVLVRQHRRLGRQRHRLATLVAINDEALKRIRRDWDGWPLRHDVRPPRLHPYAADLDLFGPASLFQLLDTATTPMGAAALRAWLLAPAAPQTVHARQRAAADLAPRLDWRQELELSGLLSDEAPPDPAPFLAWAEGPPWLANRPWLRWAAWLGPLGLVASAAAQAAGLLAVPLWILFAGVNLLLTYTVGGEAYAILSRAASQGPALGHYAASLQLLADTPFDAPLLQRLRAALTDGDGNAPVAIRRLDRLASFLVPRGSIVSPFLQLLTLWDIHLLAAFERWQATHGSHARTWLAALGEVEALAALASLAHDNPVWVFPQLDPAADEMLADALGHPLLPATTRVVNDVAVGPPGTFLLVTGSNMAGKSTLLRAIGVNIVLALAGGPVCAAACRLPPLELWTSVHVEDSLARGVSFFMAELQRLKQVVDAARRAQAVGGPRLCYLLDEILQGTNTGERQIAARRVIAFLVSTGAIGAVSTHDLTLADTPALRAAARPVHFTETVATGHQAGLSFDYKLRPGLATSTNALRLMELVGLDLPSDLDNPLPPDDGSTGTLPPIERAASAANDATGESR